MLVLIGHFRGILRDYYGDTFEKLPDVFRVRIKRIFGRNDPFSEILRCYKHVV